MAKVLRMKWSGITAEQYHESREKVGWESDPADGGILHVAWMDGGDLHVLDVWESEAHFQRFLEDRLQPIVVGHMGITTQPEAQWFDAAAYYRPGLDDK
ncbi:MAG: hypothetical protein M5R36_05970 [Deltaproteobacteria bacterium]|nr:hypothetical protein [Deltaproteobacteria bacterium]